MSLDTTAENSHEGTVQTWHGVAVRSRHGLQRPRKLGCRQSITMYNGRSVMMLKQSKDNLGHFKGWVLICRSLNCDLTLIVPVTINQTVTSQYKYTLLAECNRVRQYLRLMEPVEQCVFNVFSGMALMWSIHIRLLAGTSCSDTSNCSIPSGETHRYIHEKNTNSSAVVCANAVTVI